MNPIDAYCRDVVDGRILAGKYHRLACARHIRDRRRELTRAFRYRFDIDRADRFFRFAEKLKHYKGEWAGQTITLQDHQKFRLGSIAAWVHADTGMRRFRTAYNEVPRKNGKSLEAALIALYFTFFDGEPGAEGYCVATKRDQALIVFNDAKRLVKHSALRSRVDGAFAKHGALTREAVDAKIEALGADADSMDGLNPHVVISDEYHAQKTRALIDVMETALGARRQPIDFQITTAGDDPMSPCGEQHHYACQILDRVLVDDSFFAFIAHADPDDPPFDEKTWKKANPNYGVSVKPDGMRALARKAENMPGAAAAFKQKRLNLWVNTADPWLSLDGWRRGQSAWKLDDMHGAPCWIGIDLSSKIDLTALVLTFPPDGDRRTWRFDVWCLTPADTLADRAHRDRAPYGQWVTDGWLHTNPGKRIDQDVILEWLYDAAARFAVQVVGIDPWNAGNLLKDLIAAGFTAIEVPQTFAHMSQPSKEFEADVLDGLVDARDNPLMTWCVSNVVVQRDGKDNIYPTKKKSRGRIDPVIGALLGRRVALLDPVIPPADDPDLVVA